MGILLKTFSVIAAAGVFVAFSLINSQFLTREDFRPHEARVCIAEGHVLSDTRRPKRFTTQQYFMTQAEMVERLHVTVDALKGPQTLAEWIGRLAEAVESLTLTTGAQQWQSGQLRAELAAVLDAAGERASAVTLSLADLRGLLADRCHAADIDMRQEPHTGAQLYVRSDRAERTDLDVICQSGAVGHA